MNATIKTAADGTLEFYSGYDPKLVYELKRYIPSPFRKWNPTDKSWHIGGQYLEELKDICERLGIALAVTSNTAVKPAQKETRLLRVDYIGAPKEREDGSVTAFGHSGGAWSVIFPQDVLKGWFEIGGGDSPPAPQEKMTLYAVLNLRRNADQDAVKKAYRSMAKRWHPDANRESDAAEMFKRVNEAYQVLANPTMRRKYDAGLQLEAAYQKAQKKDDKRKAYIEDYYWRPPLRCGWLLVEGVMVIGRFVAEKILQWEDVQDAAGRVMVTSWPAGADLFVTSWV